MSKIKQIYEITPIQTINYEKNWEYLKGDNIYLGNLTVLGT